MLLDRAIPLNPGEFARLNAFLRSRAGGRAVMRRADCYGTA